MVIPAGNKVKISRNVCNHQGARNRIKETKFHNTGTSILFCFVIDLATFRRRKAKIDMFGKSKLTFELKFRIVNVYMIHTDMFSYDASRIQLNKDKYLGNSERSLFNTLRSKQNNDGLTCKGNRALCDPILTRPPTMCLNYKNGALFSWPLIRKRTRVFISDTQFEITSKSNCMLRWPS